MMPHPSIRSTGTHNPIPGGIPPFSKRKACGLDSIRSKEHAEWLATHIVRAWALEGHRVAAWVFKLPNQSEDGRGNAQAWALRTDLVGGMPSGLGKFGWEAKYGKAGV